MRLNSQGLRGLTAVQFAASLHDNLKRVGRKILIALACRMASWSRVQFSSVTVLSVLP
jgi:hypothetical protein